jgi:hypothetical protein
MSAERESPDRKTPERETPARESPNMLFQLAAGAAGIVAYVSIVGSAVISARLHALGVPVDSTLAVLPRDQILGTGIRVLSLGVAVGLFVMLVLWVLDEVRTHWRFRWLQPLDRGVPGWAIAVLAMTPLLTFAAWDGVQDWVAVTIVLVTVATAATLGVLVLVALSPDQRRRRWAFFAVIAAFGAVLAFARAYSPPVELDFADVQLEDGGRSTGFLLGQSSDSIVVAPDVMGMTIGRSVAFQRSKVVALHISNVQHKVRPIGADPVAPNYEVDEANPEERAIKRRLLQIRLSVQWKYPPMLYDDSVKTWRRRYAEFAPEGAPGALESQVTTLEDLNEQTPLFGGKVVRFPALIVQATPWDAHVPQIIVFAQANTDKYIGNCNIWTSQEEALKSRDRVDLTGVVLASGIFVSGGGTERRRVAMVCETAR